jgi:hypothetical protein
VPNIANIVGANIAIPADSKYCCSVWCQNIVKRKHSEQNIEQTAANPVPNIADIGAQQDSKY